MYQVKLHMTGQVVQLEKVGQEQDNGDRKKKIDPGVARIDLQIGGASSSTELQMVLMIDKT